MLLASLAAGCGSNASGFETTVDDTVVETSIGVPPAPPPAEVLDAELVFFDADGMDARITEPPDGPITDVPALRRFARRHVDGMPQLDDAREALAEGKVLVGGAVSSGCFAADGAILGLVAGDIRLIPVGLPDEGPEIACVRAITSVALMAIDPADVPDGATIQGT